MKSSTSRGSPPKTIHTSLKLKRSRCMSDRQNIEKVFAHLFNLELFNLELFNLGHA